MSCNKIKNPNTFPMGNKFGFLKYGGSRRTRTPRRFSRPVRYQLRSMLPYVVGATGLEPATTRLKGGCSKPTELRSHMWRSAQNSNLIPIAQYDPLSRRSPGLPGSRSIYTSFVEEYFEVCYNQLRILEFDKGM